MPSIEPLEAETWLCAFRKLADRLDKAGDHQLENLLRHAYHLLQLAPEPLRSKVRANLDEGKFEQLLEARAFDIAATALVGSGMTYIISEPEWDLFEADVTFLGESEPSSAKRGSVAAALLSAWIQCLVKMGERCFMLQAENSRRGLRKGRCGPHPRQIEH